MKLTKNVKQILTHYGSDNPGTKANLARILMNGKLGGTGKIVILPVDQGFEHGPARSFFPNPEAYDPIYHYRLAIDAGLNAYAAPLGMLELGADEFAGCIPTILKMNSANSLSGKNTIPDQATTGSVQEALRLGCSAVGFTIYPGSDKSYDMIREISAITEEAKANGLAVVVWSYARGSDISKDGETALDVIAYAAHMAALIGAHIIKVKLPTAHIEQEAAKKSYQGHDFAKATARVKHVVESCFAGKRLVVFSGGATKSDKEIFDEVHAIRDGGGNGSIIGRNSFQRPRADALKLLESVINIYKARS